MLRILQYRIDHLRLDYYHGNLKLITGPFDSELLNYICKSTTIYEMLLHICLASVDSI